MFKKLEYPNEVTQEFILQLHEHYMKGGYLSEKCMKQLITNVSEILKKEPNLIELNDSTLIYGDYHGQYFDFINQRDDTFWDDIDHIKLYLGDYVDRGKMSCEVITTLYFMKIARPERVILLRGNHESITMTQSFGFKDECVRKYSLEIYNMFLESFNCLPLAALINSDLGGFFCCHGGISPGLKDLQMINDIDRFQEIPEYGLMCDLTWSDPYYEDDYLDLPCEPQYLNFVFNEIRGCSCIFGIQAVYDFLEENDLVSIIRAHQCYESGVLIHDFGCGEESPVTFTVFGASFYNGNNKAGCVMITNEDIKLRRYSKPDIEAQYHPIEEDPFMQSIYELGPQLQLIMNSLFQLLYTDEMMEHPEKFEREEIDSNDHQSDHINKRIQSKILAESIVDNDSEESHPKSKTPTLKEQNETKPRDSFNDINEKQFNQFKEMHADFLSDDVLSALEERAMRGVDKRKSPGLKDVKPVPPQQPNKNSGRFKQKTTKVHYSISNFGTHQLESQQKKPSLRKHKSIHTSNPLLYENRKFMKDECCPVTSKILKTLWNKDLQQNK